MPPSPTLLERLGLTGLNPDKVRAAAETSHKQACARKVTAVLAGEVAPVVAHRLDSYVPRRKTATHYLDGEEQRRKKAILLENEAVIAGMLLRGIPVVHIAVIFGVTDMAIYKRAKRYGLIGASGKTRAPVAA